MKSLFEKILERKSMTKVLRNALKHAAKNHHSDIEQATNAVLRIDTHYYCSETQMVKFGNNLRRLCKEYFVSPQYNERLISEQGDTSKRKKNSLQRIAAEIGISRTYLSEAINNSNFIADPTYKNYIENRQGHLLLYSIFFEVSPLYLIGLIKDKYDYQGLFDFMITGNSDYIACHKLIRAGYIRFSFDEKADPDKINEYISYLEPLRALAAFFKKNGKETNKQCCNEIWELFKHIPWIDQNTKIPLPISREAIEEEDTYYLDHRLEKEHVAKVLQDYSNICMDVGDIDIRILIVYALLVYNKKWELLSGLRDILKNGDYHIQESFNK